MIEEKDAGLEKYLEKRAEAAENARLELCDCGGLIFDLGDLRVCGDCGTKY